MKGVVIGVIISVLLLFLGIYWLSKKSDEYGRKISAERTAATKAKYQ